MKRQKLGSLNTRETEMETDKKLTLAMVPGRVGSVTNSASRGVQNEIVSSAGNLGRVIGTFGRVGGKFGRIGERTCTYRSGIVADATK